MGKARRRGMRGLVRRVNAGASVQNRRLYLPYRFGQRYRFCTWCGEPVDEPRRRYWHSECVIWDAASKCTLTPYGAFKRRLPPYSASGHMWEEYYADWSSYCACAVCGKVGFDRERRRYDGGRRRLEVDHELAISVAVELGPRAIMRAFMPDNLRYLCHDCHVRKTTVDRAVLKILRGIEPPVLRPLPLFPEL